MTNDEKIILQARGISRTYPGVKPVAALKPCTLTLEKGTFTVIVGKSGSGKSTLLRILGTLDRPDTGDVTIDGFDLSKMNDAALARFRRRRIGFVHQDYDLFPEYTAWENTVFPLHLDGRAEDPEAIRVLFQKLGLGDCAQKFPHELSGGEQQRVSIARALCTSPAVVLADEPTGNLDAENAGIVAGILRRSVDEMNVTVAMVTHDATMAAYADRIVHIADGVVETG